MLLISHLNKLKGSLEKHCVLLLNRLNLARFSSCPFNFFLIINIQEIQTLLPSICFFGAKNSEMDLGPIFFVLVPTNKSSKHGDSEIDFKYRL